MGRRPEGWEREQRILGLMPLVRQVARRYADTGDHLDDLEQVGAIGAIKSVDRFDASRGVSIHSYAVTIISGEIRHHLRDRCWSIRVSRPLKEMQTTVSMTITDLTAKLQRQPSVREIADAADLSMEDVLDALGAWHARQPGSLTTGDGPDDEETIEIPVIDRGFDRAEGRAILAGRVAALPELEQRVLVLRLCRDMTQSQIGEELGVSQMQVSRLIRRAVDRLRVMVGVEAQAA